MAAISQIEQLKWQLRHEVSLFCRDDNRKWKQAISTTVEEIRTRRWPAVFFGGTLRSLLLSRLTNNALGRPRDIDIVVLGTELEELQQQFDKYVSRKTRFGGLQLERVGWQFDVWPLKDTYSLKEQGMTNPRFHDLPNSTFFNLEAIAVDVWARPGMARGIYSGNDQFFQGVIDKTIEINREQNPFPALCVVRAIAMAGNLQWKVGPRLLNYIAREGRNMSENEFVDVQQRHYGRVQWAANLFSRVIEFAQKMARRESTDAVELPLPKQMTFWPDDDLSWPRIRIAIAGKEKTTKDSLEWSRVMGNYGYGVS